MSTEQDFLDAYRRIKESSKRALKQVEIAIAHEEHNEISEAIAAYRLSLNYINHIFDIPVGLPENIDEVEAEWQDACAIIRNLKRAKDETSYRLKVLQKQHPSADEADEAVEEGWELSNNPPTYYSANDDSGPPRTYRQIVKGLREVIADRKSGVMFDTLFQSQVKLYKIHSNGSVHAIAGETSMSLVMCNIGNRWQFLNGTYFIQCSVPKDERRERGGGAEGGEESMIWIYPLIPTVTVCYRTNYGAFILPDLETEEGLGTAFGIMLCTPSGATEEEFNDLQQFFLDLLEAVLAGTVEELQPPTAERVPCDTSQQVSHHIVTAADFIARNLVRGAEKTGELMVKGTPYIISKIRPAPVDAAPVSSTVQTSIEVAKNVTSVAVGVTGWVAGKVGSASVALGRYLAPHIQNHGATLLEKTCGLDNVEAQKKMEGALTIAAGAVEGFTTLYNGLEKSAAILGSNLSENSVRIIEHKYGSSAGTVAASTFDTLGNAFIVSRNVNYMMPKGIAKKMVKHTGIAVVDGYKRSCGPASQRVAAGTLYPDLRVLANKEKASQEI